ncbi:ATP-binding cassette subfamily B protein [Clostridium punense]|uniref:ATP-binding cassette subfamily B protein n=1 Tax=Clostridium punense TaxID=1054297 RepID=A0ABS4K880_9CLOT|nr:MULTISPECIES: ABC transporter ATP-binding protein [Clostridium]EQB85898.1 multidrug ABC transporter ATP-binding protein [Clostridium sp. BL8]MBP2023988.1 ATP-binding cassette subfamily B protein [Clostridium punense]
MIKRFISYYAPHKKLFFLDMFCAFLVAALDLVFPMFTNKLLKSAIPNKDLRTIVTFAVVLALLYVVKLVANYIVDYWGHVMGVRLQYDMRKEVFSHLQTLPFRYFDDNKTGHIMSRIVNDLMEISELAHHGPEDIFISLVMLIGSFILLCNINLGLTLIIFAFIPVILWFTATRRVKMSNAFDEVRKKIAIVNAKLENSISGIRVAKSFTNEEYEMEKFDEGNSEFKVARSSAYKYMAEFMAGMRFLVDMLNVVVLGFGGYFVYKGYIDVIDLVTYFLYIAYFMQPIRRLTSFVEQYQSGMSGFKRFIEIMDTKSDIIDSNDAKELEKVKGNIDFKNATFKYNENTEILSNINLEIEAGKTLALVGPSGGGKTTICHLIPRFYELNEGEISIDGMDIKDVTLKSLRRNIGIVQQDVFLFTGTIKENILYGNPEASDEEVVKAAKNANIHEFICSLPDGYDTYVGERGVKLSGGQKQRISIARVFLKNPPILILDEATSALDNTSELIIQKSLEDLSKGRTTIVVAHRLSTVKNADEIVVLTDKGIIEKGPHEELMAKEGVYSKLYNAQFKGFIPDEINF